MIGTSFLLLNGGDPAVATFFLFELDGLEIGIFKEVKGLEFNMTTIDVAEGGQNRYVEKLPGRTTWSNITLRRGLTHSDEMAKWLQKYSEARYTASGSSDSKPKTQRLTGAITALTENYRRLRSWELIDATPVRWRGPEFAVGQQTQLEEELEIAHHGLEFNTFDTPRPGFLPRNAKAAKAMLR
ncbi:phage tail protein [Jatrophihabitans fulvus]